MWNSLLDLPDATVERMHFFRFLSIFFLLALLPTAGHGQHPILINPVENAVHEAIALVEEGQYGAARAHISSLREDSDKIPEVVLATLAYYDAVAALALKDADALSRVQSFRKQFRHSKWSRNISLLEGRALFDDKKFNDALRVFQSIDTANLSEAEQAELAYRMGFCRLRQNQTEQAQHDFIFAAQRKGPYQSASCYYAGHLFFSQNNDAEAKSYFDQIRHLPVYKKLMPAYDIQMAYRAKDYTGVTTMAAGLLQTADTKSRAELLPMVADAFFKEGNTEKALEFYSQLEKTKRGKLTDADLYQMGLARYSAGKYQEALATFKQMKGSNDSMAQNASYLLAQCYLKTNQKTAARSAFLQAMRSGNDSQLREDAMMNYARLALQIGSDPFEEATVLLANFTAAHPESKHFSEANQLLLKLYLQSKNYDEALQALEKTKKDQPQLQEAYEQLLFGLATSLFQEQQYSQAISYFSRMNKNRPTTIAAASLYWTGEAYYRLKNYVDAQRFMKQFAGHKSASASGLQALNTYSLAYTHFQLKEYPQALQLFKTYLSKPDDSQPSLAMDARCRVADCYFISKQWQAAIDAYAPVTVSQHHERDYALQQSAMAWGALGKPNEKLNTLDKLITQHKQSSYYDQALYEMGATYLVMNDPRSAIARFDKLVKERPRSPYAREAMLKMGLIYFNNNQPEEASRVLTNLAESYPGTPDAREALTVLKAIYMESNNIDAYFKLNEKLGFGSIAQNEQDSLRFVVAENLYLAKKQAEAQTALERYLESFSGGQHEATAHYYLAKIHMETSQDSAIPHLEWLTENTRHPYQEEALKTLARIKYEASDFEGAASYYSRLYGLTEEPQLRTEALEGLMKCNFFTQNYRQAAQQALQLRLNDQASAGQRLQAGYIAGKSWFEQGDQTQATELLQEVKRADKNAFGAEAAYLLCRIAYDQGKLEEAEKMIFELSEKFRRQDYWVASGFLLLADIYVKQNNLFQARETLKSIAENYKGDDLRQEAMRKLSILEK